MVNDLDLEVIAPDGTHYSGNQGLYASGQCLRDGKWDQCNNVEGVLVPNAQHGTYTIIVRGINVPHGPQPFALVALGTMCKRRVRYPCRTKSICLWFVDSRINLSGRINHQPIHRTMLM